MRRKRQNVYRKCFYGTDTRCNIFVFSITIVRCKMLEGRSKMESRIHGNKDLRNKNRNKNVIRINQDEI